MTHFTPSYPTVFGIKTSRYLSIPVEHVSAGTTICNERQCLSGIHIIKKGYVTVIHPHPKGGYVSLGPDSYFGELVLIFPNPMSVIIHAMTNCEVWVLRRSDFQRLVPYLPRSVMKKIRRNYFNILKTKDCEYHHNLPVRKPKNFPLMSYQYFKNNDMSALIRENGVTGKMISARASNNSQRRKILILLHRDMKFVKLWNIMIFMLAVAAVIRLFFDLAVQGIGDYGKTAGTLDCIWPNNPVSLTHLTHGGMLYSKVSMIFSFILSLIFLADLIISLITVDEVLYNFINKLELFKSKIAFQDEGVMTLINFMSVFLTGLKITSLLEPLKVLDGRLKLPIFALLLLVICVYMARISYYSSYLNWTNDNSFCEVLKREWSNDPEHEIDELCNATPMLGWNKSCISLGPVFQMISSVAKTTLRDADSFQTVGGELVDEMSLIIQKRKFLLHLSDLCSKKWDGQSVHGGEETLFEDKELSTFQLGTILSLFSIAALEGNDVIALFPNTYSHMLTMTLATYFGMIVLAVMSAKATAKEKAGILPTVQVFQKEELLRNLMNNKFISEKLVESILRFWRTSSLEYNRINFIHQEDLMRSLTTFKSLKINANKKDLDNFHYSHHQGGGIFD